MAQDQGFENVIIEGDSKVVMDAINSGVSYNSILGDYVRKCNQFIVALPSYSVTFMKHEANLLAHKIAKSSISYGVSHCWSDPPNFSTGLSLTFIICVII